MKDGIYEKVIDIGLKQKTDNKKYKDDRTIDKSEISKVLSTAYQKLIYEAFLQFSTDEERIVFVSKLNNSIGINPFIYDEKKFKELLLVHNEKEEFDLLKEFRPRTSLAHSTLFTGATELTLESELKREILTADSFDMLVSFIKYSGLRLIYDELVEFTKTRRLRIITTSYMGASDYKAIVELSKLPNTEVRISYDTKRTRLHAKAYYFKRDSGFSTAYIGSSNLSNPALSNGLEWNLKVSEYTSKDVIDGLIKTFESYWNDDEFRFFDANDKKSRIELKESLETKGGSDQPYIFFDLKPYSHQREILEDLQLERDEYNSFRNLVVAATGTGKTMIAAFDYKEQLKYGDKKLLFLAHRMEILEQSLYTFRSVLKDQNFGELWVGEHNPEVKTHLFASVQTLNSSSNYLNYAVDYFDYIVIDETHHAAAASYFRILEHFTPKILLGLTATPERMDGQNILEYFNNRIASEIRLADGINRKLLSPFHYFGVADPIDLSHLKWSRGSYEISELENVYTKSKQRVQVILDSMEHYLKDMESFRALGFCVSITHANFMAAAFNEVGIPAMALHSNSSKDERNSAKEKLKKREINCIFTVDLFNEGVDIPDVDTILFLRPTESLTVFIQQLGRGLRLTEDKEVLTVLDFVGRAHTNYDFSFKFRALIGRSKQNIKGEIEEEFPNMPTGCHIKLEKIAKEYILNNIQSSIYRANNLERMIRDYELNFDTKLNLRNFLDNYEINKNQFYSRYSFYNLLAETGRKEKYLVKDSKELKQALRRFARVDSKRLLQFTGNLLKRELVTKNLSHQEKLLLGMFHYIIWGEKPVVSYIESLERLKNDNEDIVAELIEIVDYNLSNLRIKELPYEDASIPLDVYGSYTINQIMVAFGETDEKSVKPIREGVYYIKKVHTDLFFITIHKNEEDYLPSTLYNDYAINSELFNWESQSRTGVESPTGQRYINNRDEKHKVLLFVREVRSEYSHAVPYIFLGNAKYVSHSGSKPIQIVWKMDHPIPERIIRESNLRVVN